MTLPFSLIASAWLPIRRLDGTIERILPHEIVSNLDANPVVSFAWPRPELDLAAHEFLIGLLAVAFPPRNQAEWLDRFETPPSPGKLQATFAPWEHVFSLDGDGPRFLQDFEPLKGAPSPIEALFIEAPGANTVKLNKDLLVKRDRFRALSRASAAMALYTLQQFAPSGGAGHRTSLRGGGPLVTLVMPARLASGSPPTLWQRLWLHVSIAEPLDRTNENFVFPWLAPTKTSARKESVSLSPSDPVQANFFGMPRRIRLVFESNEARRPCDLTGEIDDVNAIGFVTEPWGVNYSVCRHPLTPYYRVKSDTLPVHAPEGRLGYRQWLGLAHETPDGTRLPATAVVEAQRRLGELNDQYAKNSTLFAAGYAMDNMKALAFAEAEMPLHAVGDPALENDIRRFADRLVKAAATASSALAVALKSALFGPKSNTDIGSTLVDAPRERLWAETEREFHEHLSLAIARFPADESGDEQIALARSWRDALRRCALRIFDETAPLDDFGAIEPKYVVEGRRLLTRAFDGFGKFGQALSKELGLPPPETQAKGTGSSRTKTAEEVGV